MLDYHIHTTYSPDAESSMEAQLRAAYDAGLDEICLTDHLDINHQDSIFDRLIDYGAWLRELEALRPKFPGMCIRAGIEAGEQPDTTAATLKIVKAHPFDYVLLAQHMIDGKDPYRYDEFLAGRQTEAAYMRYAECVWQSLNRFNDFDCLAHLGYCSKFAPRDPRHPPFCRDYAPDLVDMILKKLAQDGKALEINTSGLKNGGLSAIPGPDIVKRFSELGGEFVMFGSDAHVTKYVGYKLDYARSMAMSCGIKYTLSFERRHAIAIRLDRLL